MLRVVSQHQIARGSCSSQCGPCVYLSSTFCAFAPSSGPGGAILSTSALFSGLISATADCHAILAVNGCGRGLRLTSRCRAAVLSPSGYG